MGDLSVCVSVQVYLYGLPSAWKIFQPHPPLENKIAQLQKTTAQRWKWPRNCCISHLPLLLWQQHKEESLSLQGNGLKCVISTFFYKFALFLFCIFIWKKLKLHQKIAQKCCYCKTIKVTFVLRSHFSVHGFLHTEFQMTTLFRGTTCPPDVVGQMKPDTTLTLFAHLFLANKRMYLVVN